MMNDNEIRQLLETMEIQPSGHCWEAIESQLAAATTSAVATTANVATKAAAHALSTTAKVAIGVVAATAITTTAILIGNGKTEITSTEPATPNMIVATHDTIAEISTIPDTILDKSIDNQLFINCNTEKMATGSIENVVAIAPTELAAESSASSSFTESYHNSHSSAPAQSEKSPSAATTQYVPPTISATRSPNEAIAESKIVIEQTETVSMTDFSDPVLENVADISNFDFSQPVAVVIPNVITPNGDGVNDFFVITGIEQCERNRLLIHQRNGAVVFKTVNYQNDWGADNVPAGTYFYQFCYTIHGIEEVRTGTLTILR